MDDTIYRQAAISAICNACGKIDCDKMDKCEKLQLSPANNSEIPNSSDTISRQQAIDAVMECYDNDELLEVYVWKLYELPPIQPIQPKKGRWILVTNGRSGHECDKCHNYAPSYQSGEEHLSDFCPHCGADMRGEQDDSF